MKTRIALVTLAMAAMSPVYASGSDMVSTLVDETGLTERQVLMIVGNRSPYIEHRYNYSRALAQFNRALGRDRAARLIAGETVVIERRAQASIATRNQSRSVASAP